MHFDIEMFVLNSAKKKKTEQIIQYARVIAKKAKLNIRLDKIGQQKKK